VIFELSIQDIYLDQKSG